MQTTSDAMSLWKDLDNTSPKVTTISLCLPPLRWRKPTRTIITGGVISCVEHYGSTYFVYNSCAVTAAPRLRPPEAPTTKEGRVALARNSNSRCCVTVVTVDTVDN